MDVHEKVRGVLEYIDRRIEVLNEDDFYGDSLDHAGLVESFIMDLEHIKRELSSILSEC